MSSKDTKILYLINNENVIRHLWNMNLWLKEQMFVNIIHKNYPQQK